MMEKILCLVVVVLVSGVARVSSLQCYACIDCPNPTDDDLKTCAETISPTIALTTILDTPPAKSFSTSGSNEIKPSTTTTIYPTTTTISPTTTTTKKTTSTTSPTTTTASPTSTSKQQPSLNDSRLKRSILSVNDQGGCDCREEDCDCNGVHHSSRIAQYADEFVCVKATVTDNGTAFIVRDCAYANNTEGLDPCEEVKDVDIISSCNFCNTDKCNGSNAHRLSTFIILGAISIIMLK